MAEKPARSSLKRPLIEDETSDKKPPQKRVRFPKGKKVKSGYEVVDGGTAGQGPGDDLKDPRLAAKERAHRRNQITAELLNEESEGFLNDISTAEETYEKDGNRTEDGIQIEPFNLNREREEGYFDAEGNFVEYVTEKEVKDAWLDSIEADPKYIGGVANDTENDDDEDGNGETDRELSSDELGLIKRRIANTLEPGETVLQALRRLKGISNNRKEKMSAETKHRFDQLTEDADKLIQNGEYNVYHDKKEVFEREAEGYERLAQVRGQGTPVSGGQGSSTSDFGQSLYSDIRDLPSGSGVGHSISDATITEIKSAGGYDMFADDDEQDAHYSATDGSILPSGISSSAVTQSSSEAPNASSEAVASQYYATDGSDYTYDESSGYYYSSSLGYYYDPTTRLYCSATTGQWYSFNEERGIYEEVKEASSSAS